MEALISHIKIGNLNFDFVHEVEIEKTWKNLTNTARVFMPKALKVDANQLKDSIPNGSEVIIELGYESSGLVTVFEGFVSRLKPTTPIEIECQDEMWKLKQIPVTQNAKAETLQSYLEKIQPYPVNAFEITLASYVAQKQSVAQVLDDLKQQYRLAFFFRNGTLTVAKQYDKENAKKHRFILENSENCNIKADNLEYSSKEDMKLKVTAISNLPSGEKLEVVIGDPEGEERTLNFFDLSKSDLEKIATQEMERLRYDGYKGTFDAFGLPLVEEGDLIQLINDQESDKTGTYWCDGVVYKFGAQTMGFQQTIQLGSIS